MLARLSSLSLTTRLLLASLAATPVAFAWPAVASAQDEDDEDDDEGGDDGGAEEEDEQDAMDPDQPKVTAGGLFTKATYPTSEVERPLSITQGLFEARAGITFDLSKGRTFDIWNLDLVGRYGLADTLELRGYANLMIVKPDGLDGIHTFGVGVEPAIVYDLVDFRGSVEITTGLDETNIGFVVGFPIKYRLKDNLAIFALERFFIINTVGDPDLNIVTGAVLQVAPTLAVYFRAEIFLRAFDTENEMKERGTLGLAFSPSGAFDAGAEFTLLDILPKAPPGTPPGAGDLTATDERALTLYARLRI